MTYKDIRDFSLQLIRQYTVAGTPYASTYNNQQDYLNSIPFLVNDCLIYIASSIRKMPAVSELYKEDGEEYGKYLRFVLPEDLIELRTGGFLIPEEHRSDRVGRFWKEYTLLPPDHVLLPRSMPETLIVQYNRRPQLLSSTPSDTDRIDADMDVQMAIPYYVASHLVMEDDAFRYASLYNEFENKVARMAKPLTTEIGEVEDAYGYDIIAGGF